MKFLKSLFILVLLAVFFVPTVHAQSACDIPGINSEACNALIKLIEKKGDDGPWYNQNFSQFAKKVTDKSNPDAIFGERYTFAQINWIVNSVATMLNPAAEIQNAGDLIKFILKVKEMFQASTPPSLNDYARLGPAGLFAGGVTALYSNPPASAVSETKYMASIIFDFGTGTTPVYAAEGYGYSGLSSGGAVRALWTASRNMSYLIIVVILIASGFMIMFRVKINPQTVVSLQTMIPKLVTTLILITFSFAIAGLIIDLIYVIIVAFVGLLNTPGVGIIDSGASIGEIIKWLTDPGFGWYFFLQAATSVLVLGIISAIFIGTGLPTVIGVIILIALAIFWIITMFKIFWMLINSYITLLLQIAIGPLQIMLDLIPGQQGFGPWIRNIIANASVFAVVPIMLVIQHVISWDPITNNILKIKSLGPFGGFGGTNLQLPYYDLFGRWGQGALGEFNFITRMFIGIIILGMTPKIAEIIRDLLKIPAFKYGTAWSEPFKEAFGAWSTYEKARKDTGALPDLVGTAKETIGRLKPTPTTQGEAPQGFSQPRWDTFVKGTTTTPK